MMGRKERHFAPLINVSVEQLVPQDHFYRHLERTLDLSFVREFVEKTYAGGGRPSIDPIVFFKLQLVNWIEEVGAQDRRVSSRGYQRLADLRVSTTDPDATLMPTKDGADMGYHTHYVVDGGKARITLQVLVTASEVMDNQPMLDLLWRVRFRWELWPRQVTGDRKYGTEENLVAIEREHIHAYIPSPDVDHRTAFFSTDRFRYESGRDIYLCPAGKELRFDRPHSTERSRRYRARAKDCNHCPLKAQCTTSKQGRTLCRSVDEEYLDRVRAYQSTKPYQKALRKRSVWVEPLFAEGKDCAFLHERSYPWV